MADSAPISANKKAIWSRAPHRPRKKLSFTIRHCEEWHGIIAACGAELLVNSARRSSWWRLGSIYVRERLRRHVSQRRIVTLNYLTFFQ